VEEAMATVDTILAKAKAMADGLEEQKIGAFIRVLFFDQEVRETFMMECDLEDIPQTREDLQTILDQGARPVCLVFLPIRDPIFVELDKDLSVEDHAIIDGLMEGGRHGLISRRRDPPAEGNDNG
jgi:hypothetical protein